MNKKCGHQIEDEHVHFTLGGLLAETVSVFQMIKNLAKKINLRDSSGGGFIDNTEDIKTSNSARILSSNLVHEKKVYISVLKIILLIIIKIKVLALLNTPWWLDVGHR